MAEMKGAPQHLARVSGSHRNIATNAGLPRDMPTATEDAIMRRAILIGSAAAAVTAFTMAGALAQVPTTTPQTGRSQPSVKDSSKNPAQPPAGASETRGNTPETTGMSPNGTSNGTMSRHGKGHTKKDGIGK